MKEQNEISPPELKQFASLLLQARSHVVTLSAAVRGSARMVLGAGYDLVNINPTVGCEQERPH